MTPMRSASTSGRVARNARALRVSSTCSRQITRPRTPSLWLQPRMSKRSAANSFALATLPPLSLLLPKPCRTRKAGRRSREPRASGRCSTPVSFRPPEANVTRSSILPVQPHFLHARVVVDDVMGDEIADLRPLDEVAEAPAEDGLGHIRLEALLDLEDERQSL